MFESIKRLFKKMGKTDAEKSNSKDAAKERLHLVLMQDRANVSADFLELMRQEIIEVIKKYIDVDESAIDVRMTNRQNDDGTNGAPALYANIPILSIKDDVLREKNKKNNENSDKKPEEKKVAEEETAEQEEKKVESKEEVPKKIEDIKTENKTEEKDEPKKEEEKMETANKE